MTRRRRREEGLTNVMLVVSRRVTSQITCGKSRTSSTTDLICTWITPVRVEWPLYSLRTFKEENRTSCGVECKPLGREMKEEFGTRRKTRRRKEWKICKGPVRMGKDEENCQSELRDLRSRYISNGWSVKRLNFGKPLSTFLFMCISKPVKVVHCFKSYRVWDKKRGCKGGW